MDPFLGQIQPFGFNFAPRGWAKCDGQLLAISSYSALFALLGTTFGGDGRTSFGLPDLRGRSITHIGTGIGLDTISWGERDGRELITLGQQNMPQHSHVLVNGTANVVVNVTDNADVSAEAEEGANGLGTGGTMLDIYRENPTVGNHIAGVAISGNTNPSGGSQAFASRNPFLGINVCIAMVGIFPSRS